MKTLTPQQAQKFICTAAKDPLGIVDTADVEEMAHDLIYLLARFA